MSSLKLSTIKDHFQSRFNSEPVLVESPGRVNLIGEHTDYNDGFVLPAAIDKKILFGIALNDQHKIRAYSIDMDEYVEMSLDQLTSGSEQWFNYIKGVVAELEVKGYSTKGFDLVFGGDIPIGSGLSSSAALEGGVLVGLDHLNDFKLPRMEMARIGQLTEHNHVGVMCGIMDQFANLHGEQQTALLLDCRSLTYQQVPFTRDDIKIVLCNSMVSHYLASSEYNVRRSQCEEGVAILKEFDPSIKNLRDISLQLFTEHKHRMLPKVADRCEFVIKENKRVQDANTCLSNNDFKGFGELMFESHNGLSKKYQVSCDELDILFEIAKDQEGLIGCRMMGGGFGGCTINLVEEQFVDQFTDQLCTAYKERTGIETEIYITSIESGTKIRS